MPFVSLEAMPGQIDQMQKESLKGYLRFNLSRLFSLEDRQLDERSFSFGFPVFDEGTDLTHEFTMRIRLNPDPARLVNAPMSAIELYEGVRETLYESTSPHLWLRVGICLDFGIEIVWCDENGVI